MRLTPAQRRQVRTDYQNKPVKDVLTKWGISRRYLYKIVGEKKRGAKARKVDDRIKSIIVTMNMKGWSDHKIADVTGLSQDTVSRHRRTLKRPALRKKDQRQHA